VTSEPGSKGTPMARRRFIQGSAALVSTVAISAAATPTLLRARADPVRPQVPVPVPDTDSELSAQLRRGQPLPASDGGDLLVLNYHKVFGDLNPPPALGNIISVTASQLMSHLMMLRSAGFTSVRLADVVRARAQGATLPPRSVLITFDDGTAGQWISADAVLRQAGFTAVTFLITSYVGRAPFVNWREVRAMVASGRWEVGDHTHNDHHVVPSGPAMPLTSSLITRAWNPRTRTMETLTGAEARVRSDLLQSLTTLQTQGLTRPLAFAYPFSKVDGPTNDRRLSDYVEQALASLFPLRFTNYSPCRLVSPAELAVGLLPRLEVHRPVSALELYEQIRAASMVVKSPTVEVLRNQVPAQGLGHNHTHTRPLQ